MQDKIKTDLKNAQLSKDEIKVSTLRLLLSEVKNSEIAKGGALSDEDVLAVVTREAKKRKEAILAFRSGGREEAAIKEEQELKVLWEYLPPQMGREELGKIIEVAINEIGASSMADMGKVMGVVMGKVKGQTDGIAVSNLVREKLSA